MVDIKGHLKYPFSNPKRLLLGVLFMIIPIANFISMGYILKAARAIKKGENSLPEWSEYPELFLDGLLFMALSLVFSFVIGILFRFIVPLAIGRGIILLSIIVIIAIALLLGGLHLLMSMLLIYVYTNKLAEVLRPWSYKKQIMDKEFLKASCIGILILSAYTTITGLIPTINFVLFFPASLIGLLTYFSFATTKFKLREEAPAPTSPKPATPSPAKIPVPIKTPANRAVSKPPSNY